MIHDKSEGVKDVLSFHSGKMKQGLGINNPVVDQYLRFKDSEFNVIAGLSNVGKTYWVMWYYLCLAVTHGTKFLIYSNENEVWIIKSFLINFLIGMEMQKAPEKYVHQALNIIDDHFDFVKAEKLYNVDELLELFDKSEAQGFVIDPHNSLQTPRGVNRHEYDYETAGKFRLFTRKTGKPLYLIAHCVTEAIRRMYPKGHDLEGYALPPNSSDIEGGGKWVNRCDNFLILHNFI